MRLGQPANEATATSDAEPMPAAPPVVVATEPRDPRVPPPGTVVRRVFDGKTHDVTVCAEGFEYAGTRYKTLSAVAVAITGTRWNGFLFTGLKKRGD